MKVETSKEIPKKVSEKTMTTETHKHPFMPLLMAILAFGFIVISYLYCHISGLETNGYREVASIGISGFFAVYCWYLNEKSK